MTKYPLLWISSYVYVQITPSNTTANLVQLETSILTSDHEQDLKLDPDSYSIDLVWINQLHRVGYMNIISFPLSMVYQ